jgi:hypothetical protein
MMMMINMGYHRVVDVVFTATTRHHRHRIHHVLQSNRSICSSSFRSIRTERFIIIRQQQQQQQQFYSSSKKYSISTINRSNSSSSSGGDGGARSSDSSDSNKYDVLGITIFSSICVLCSGLGAWQVKR